MEICRMILCLLKWIWLYLKKGMMIWGRKRMLQPQRYDINYDSVRQIIRILTSPFKFHRKWWNRCCCFDVEAIKKAAGNRYYKDILGLPQIKRIEQEKQPKELLHQLLRTVSGLKGRNLSRFNPHFATHLVVDNIRIFHL